MVTFPKNGELKKLKTFKKSFCASIYIPRLGPEASPDANRIAAKNILREVGQALAGAGAKPKIIQKTLAPAYTLIERPEFWMANRESVAFFAHAKLFRYYRLPTQRTPQMVTISQGFMLGPMLDAMLDDAPYYLLTLSHNRVQLFDGSHYELHPIHPRDLPRSMKEALRIDEYPHWQETHAVAPSSRNNHSEAFHGQYNVAQTDKIMLTEFFHRINKRLRKLFKGERKPLIIGGVDYLLPLYRHANTYPYLLPGSIKGNLEHANLDSLRERAWKIVRSIA